jgi:hypothetical protein
MPPSNSLATQPPPSDTTSAKVIESLVLRGDLSGLTPVQRARHYIQMCETLGLNPASHPFAFLRLNGKEILYTTRGATDQLAAIHRLNREIIDGPKVIDLAGTKLVYAVCRATHPNGRVETAVATVPLQDPQNVLMKAETKCKRRATLSILGLGMLDEMELETIPANVQEPGGGVDLSLAEQPAQQPAADANAETPTEVPAQLGEFYERMKDIELPGEAVAVWMKHRADLAPLPSADREAAWQALCRRTEEVGKMKNAKVWLKKAISEEDARRMQVHVDPGAALSDAGDPRAETPRSDADDAEVEAEELAPSSRAYASFLERLSGAQKLVLVVDLYAALLAGLREESHAPEGFIGGDDGAAAQARQRILALGHRITKAEAMQVVLSRALAEILDDQVGIEPGPRALQTAADWWRANLPRVKTLEHAHRWVPWYALARRYSGAQATVDVKRATKALEDAVALKTPPPGGGGSPSRGGAANGQGGTRETAAQGEAAQACGALGEFRAHLARLAERGADRGAARVAGGYWKRRADFLDEGTHAEAMGVVIDELTRRGVNEPGSWLTQVGKQNGYLSSAEAA